MVMSYLLNLKHSPGTVLDPLKESNLKHSPGTVLDPLKESTEKKIEGSPYIFQWFNNKAHSYRLYYILTGSL